MEIAKLNIALVKKICINLLNVFEISDCTGFLKYKIKFESTQLTQTLSPIN